MIYYVSQLFTNAPEKDTIVLTTTDENEAAQMVAECYVDLFLSTGADLRKPFSQLVAEYRHLHQFPRFEMFAEGKSDPTVNELGIEAIKTVVHGFHHVVEDLDKLGEERFVQLPILMTTLKRARRILHALTKQDLMDIWQILNVEDFGDEPVSVP